MEKDYPVQGLSGKTLVIYSGQIEFGWLVATWIPYCRKRSRRHWKTVVYCEKGHRYLYEDFAHVICEFKAQKGKRDRWLFNGKKIKVPKKVKKCHLNDKIIIPTKNKCLSDKREYFRYGQEIHSDMPWHRDCYSILIHARSVKQNDWIDRACGGSRNWPMKNWSEFTGEFYHSTKSPKKRMAFIGSRDGATNIQKIDDLRGAPIDRLCTIIRNAKVVVGTSSGPMHLAHLCGTPIVVFSDARIQKYIGGSNKVRYTKAWRAWKDVPVKVLEHPKWKPKVEKVVKAVRRFL